MTTFPSRPFVRLYAPNNSVIAPKLKHLVITERVYTPRKQYAFKVFIKWLRYFLYACPSLVTLGINMSHDFRELLMAHLKVIALPLRALEILGFAFKLSHYDKFLHVSVREDPDTWWWGALPSLRNIVVSKKIKILNHVSFDDNGEDSEPEIFYYKYISLRDVYDTLPHHIISIKNTWTTFMSSEADIQMKIQN